MTTKTYDFYFDEYRADLHNICYSILNDYHDAEDQVQETYLRGYLRLDSLGSIRSLKYWLIRVAKNLSLTLLKKKKSRRSHYAFERGAVDQNFQRVDLALAIEKKKPSMPPTVYRGLILKHYYGLSWCEASKQMGLKHSTLKSRVHRYRKKDPKR